MDRIEALRAFVRLVEVGSFTEVARELRVKQSTVSKWMASLEAELGVQLLERTTRSLRVTDAGTRFGRQARAIVGSYDVAVTDARRGQTELCGRVRLSLPVAFGRLHVVPLIASFAAQHPQLELALSFDDRYTRLVEEGFDMAIRVGAPVSSSLRCRTLANPPRRLVAAPGYLAAFGTPRRPADLQQHECLVHTSGDRPAAWSFSRAGKSFRVNVQGRISADNSEATLTLCGEGFGIALLSSWLVDADVRRGQLVVLLPEYTLPPAPVQALLPPGPHTTTATRSLLQHLSSGLKERLGAQKSAD